MPQKRDHELLMTAFVSAISPTAGTTRKPLRISLTFYNKEPINFF